ncbi:hypothetical protein KOY_05286 [Bacillus cereus VDM021]|nr:hypothetical protein KOY_05286 [Bacillus cereus VDM021]
MYINSYLYKFKHRYDIDYLVDHNSWCERDIKRLEELIKDIRKHQQEVYEHAQQVLNTEMKNIVTITRMKNYSAKRVEYYVRLEIRPLVPFKYVENEKVYGTYKENKMFAGKERHLAFKYAKELCNKYNCEIERKGF